MSNGTKLNPIRKMNENRTAGQDFIKRGIGRADLELNIQTATELCVFL